MEQALERKEIIKHVKARIDRGEPKQLILEELSSLYKDKVTIMSQLEHTPSKSMKSKYRTYNYVLAALMVVVLVLHALLLFKQNWGIRWVLDITTALNAVLDVIFVIGVLLYRIEIYSWIASSALVTLITIVVSLYYESHGLNPLLFVSLPLTLISFLLGLYLAVKLCPPRVPKIIEVDIDGTEKINKTVYVFAD